jgi:hypothetical protein
MSQHFILSLPPSFPLPLILFSFLHSSIWTPQTSFVAAIIDLTIMNNLILFSLKSKKIGLCVDSSIADISSSFSSILYFLFISPWFLPQVPLHLMKTFLAAPLLCEIISLVLPAALRDWALQWDNCCDCLVVFHNSGIVILCNIECSMRIGIRTQHFGFPKKTSSKFFITKPGIHSGWLPSRKTKPAPEIDVFTFLIL